MTRRKELIDGFCECGCCYQVKPISEFGKDRGSWSGIRGCCKACRRQEYLSYQARRKLEVMKQYCFGLVCCSVCKITDIDVLTIDHIDESGAKLRKHLGGKALYCWLKKQGYPEGYQVLCFNCNFKKSLKRLKWT